MSGSSFFQPAIQPKLSVNKPNDAYEQEADLIADRVVNMPETNAHSVLTAPPDVQLQEQENEEEEETIQASTFSVQRMSEEEEEESPSIQTKQISIVQRNENSLQAASDEEEESVQMYAPQRSPTEDSFCRTRPALFKPTGHPLPAVAGKSWTDPHVTQKQRGLSLIHPDSKKSRFRGRNSLRENDLPVKTSLPAPSLAIDL